MRWAASGAVLVVGAAALVLRSLVADALPAGVLPRAWELVLGTWLAAGSTFALAGPVTRLWAWDPPRDDADDGLLTASLVFPAVGLALLGPVTLHMPLVLAVAGAAAFDQWCTRGVGLVAHAHLVLAVFVAHRAAVTALARMQACTGPSTRAPDGHTCAGGPAVDDPLGPTATYVLTIVVSAIPFGAAHVVPPLLVALTGIPLVALASVAAPSIGAGDRAHAAKPAALTRAGASRRDPLA